MTREEAIKVIDGRFDIMDYCENARLEEALDLAIESLKQSQPQWIPCTPETMPEEKEWIGTKEFGTTISDKVLVTFERPDGSRFVKDLCFQNGKLGGFDQHSIDVFNRGSIPIMWMPWPEPYQKGKQK